MSDAQNPPDVSTPDATAATAQSRGLEESAPAAPAATERRAGAVPFTLGARVTDAATAIRSERSAADPIFRPLKIYTTDPARQQQDGETALINVPYEPLRPGPIGLRFEVVSTDKGP